jgi:hypothetical protein
MPVPGRLCPDYFWLLSWQHNFRPTGLQLKLSGLLSFWFSLQMLGFGAFANPCAAASHTPLLASPQASVHRVLDVHDELAEMLALVDVTYRGHRFVERIRPVDDRNDFVLCAELQHVFVAGPVPDTDPV